MRKLAFCICENKSTEDRRLCVRYIDNIIPLLPKAKLLSLKSSSMAAQPSLCRTWSETLKTGFLTTRLTLFQGKIKVYIACRPKLESKQSKKAANIQMFGSILLKLIQIYDDQQKVAG